MTVVALDSRFFLGDCDGLDRIEHYQTLAAEALEGLKRDALHGAPWLGWYDYPRRKGLNLVEGVLDFTRRLPVHYDLVLVVGIGGSYLGTRAVADALNHTYHGLVEGRLAGNRPLIVYAGHNLSETNLIELVDLLERHEPIVNVISKSGTTTEPSVAFRVIRRYLEKRFGVDESKHRIIATTDREKGALRKMANAAGWKTFDIPDDIGGRYSVLSPVGIVPLALGGFAIDELMQGAHALFSELAQGDLRHHPVSAYAAARMAAYGAGKTIDILAYSEPKLATFVEWWKQLFGESQGKDHKGMFPVGLASTTDLHSLGQIVQEGMRNLMETFLTFQNPRTASANGVERQLRLPHMTDSSDELGYLENRLIEEVNATAVLGTRMAHADGGVPNVELKCGQLTEFTLGGLFAFFETACAVGGKLLAVDPFDQPGVEAYKNNLFALLGKPGFETLGAELRRRLVK